MSPCSCAAWSGLCVCRGGSFYLQSKIWNAKEALLEDLRRKASPSLILAFYSAVNPRNARALPPLGSLLGQLVLQQPVLRLGLEGVAAAAAALLGAQPSCRAPLYITGCLVQQYHEQSHTVWVRPY